MVCPKCGSKNTQFATNTSGKGYRTGNGCCGYMFLGPIGLLCGGCGSGVETEEFWICHDCGNKFSNFEGQSATKVAVQEEATAQQIAANCERYKKDLGDKSPEYYKKMYENAKTKLRLAEIDYQRNMDKLLKASGSNDELTRKYQNSTKEFPLALRIIFIIMILAGIVLCFAGGAIIGVPLIALVIIIGLVSVNKEEKLKDKVEERFTSQNPQFKACMAKKEKAQKDMEYWKSYVDKVNYIEKYDKPQ